MASLIKYYNNLLKKYPWTTQSFTTAIIMTTGDGISQLVIEKKKFGEFDFKRSSRFFIFGSLFLGPVLRTWYATLSKFIRGSPAMSSVKMVAADQLLFSPSFLVVFLSTMTFWRTGSPEYTVSKVKQDYFPTLKNNWKVWPMAQLINFYFIPLQHRVLYVNTVALFWNIYLANVAEKHVNES